MSYVARSHLSIGDLVPASDYNQGMDNEAQLKVWVDDAAKASMTNKSGSDLTAGTVVILDATSDSAFKTTTSPSDRRVIGVLFEDIINNAAGLVSLASKKQTTLVQGNVARGDFLVASSTAGRAASAGRIKPAVGAFGVAITAYAGGGAGSVDAIIFPSIEIGLAAGSLYSAGGYQAGVNVATMYKWDSATDTTASVAGGPLSTARRFPAGCGATLKGFYLGGYVAANSAIVDALTFSTEVTVVTNAIPTALATKAPHLSSTDIYVVGGDVNASYGVARSKMNISTEAHAALAASALGAAGRAGVWTSAYGYAAGGHIAGPSSTTAIYRTAFATDVETLLSSVLTSIRGGASSGIQSATAALFLGGTVSGGPLLTDANRFVFSTESVAVAGSAALTTARHITGSGGDGAVRGFVLGGSTTATKPDIVSAPSVIADQVALATEVTSAVSGANLPTATGGPGGAFGG